MVRAGSVISFGFLGLTDQQYRIRSEYLSAIRIFKNETVGLNLEIGPSSHLPGISDKCVRIKRYHIIGWR